MYSYDEKDLMRISFAKNSKELAVVFDGIEPFELRQGVAVYKTFEELRSEQSSIFVIGKNYIPKQRVPKGKQYVFIGIENLIFETDKYPFAISTTVTDIEIASLIISDALLCSEDRNGISISPLDFYDIADAKILKFASLDNHDAIKKANGLWYCASKTKPIPEINKILSNILVMTNGKCDIVFTVACDDRKDGDFVIVTERINGGL
jgi:hypothetical protein